MPMIDVKLIRSDPEGIKSAMARRGVDPSEVDQVIVADEGWRQVLAAQEASRSAVKSLSKKFGEAKRSGDEGLAATVAEQSRIEGEKQTELGRKAQQAEDTRRDLLLRLPNLPDPQAPQGDGPEDNPTVKWWAPFPLGDKPDATIESHFAEHQRVPHWEIGAELGILDMERGAKLSGAMFPMFRGMGATLVRALIGWALNSHSNQDGPFGAFEEVRPPTLVRTETMISTGALPKFADDAYHLERDDLWAIPTAEVPLTSLARDEILAQGDLPRLMTAYTPCYRR
ncbi:MAG TPA: serine--tRNA ligase, partial [Acidimicrobiales bacterium]|nr:serine--tRNA ligase [Acidimicrobiales bacterium]